MSWSGLARPRISGLGWPHTQGYWLVSRAMENTWSHVSHLLAGESRLVHRVAVAGFPRAEKESRLLFLLSHCPKQVTRAAWSRGIRTYQKS